MDAVLVATGRVPSSKGLNLESLGVETNRGFVPIDDAMHVLVNGQPVPNLWAVGDVTGKLMLAHTAAAQGTVAVDNILGHDRQIDYRSIPAATFTHPEISSVGLSEADAKTLAAEQGFQLGSVRSYFKANSKALAELESDGLMKLLFNKTSGEVLGAHIYGLHAADLIQEVANAVARRQACASCPRKCTRIPPSVRWSKWLTNRPQPSWSPDPTRVFRFRPFDQPMEIRRRPPNPKVRVAHLEYAVPHDDEEPRHILEKIVWEKDQEVEATRQKVPLESLKRQIADLPPTQDFLAALKAAPVKPAVIAEVKKASPSKG